MDKIAALLARKTTSADELRAALPSLSIAKAEQKVTELEAKRKSVLISGDMLAVAAADRQIATANLEVERTATLIDEIAARLDGRGGRLAQVLALSEAGGRRNLAQHLAEQTEMTIDQIRAVLSHVGIDEGEHSAETVALYRKMRAGKLS